LYWIKDPKIRIIANGIYDVRECKWFVPDQHMCTLTKKDNRDLSKIRIRAENIIISAIRNLWKDFLCFQFTCIAWRLYRYCMGACRCCTYRMRCWVCLGRAKCQFWLMGPSWWSYSYSGRVDVTISPRDRETGYKNCSIFNTERWFDKQLRQFTLCIKY
jgi:hypothetical protein